MRAKEFTINIPINITMNADGSVDVDTPNQAASDEAELDQNPVMVPPLQQQIELDKAEAGKDSPVIDDLTADSEIGAEDEEEQEVGNPNAR